MITAAEILETKKVKIFTLPSSLTIHEALTIMVERKIGAIVLHDGEESNIVGIWTERDLMRNTLDADFNPRTAVIADHMTTGLISAPSSASINELKDMILGLFIRHILIKEDEKYIGLLSVGDIVRASLLAQDQHIRDLKARASWQYYENWGWNTKR